METVTGFLNVVRQMEIERRDRHGKTNKRAANNGWKGHVPALLQEGAGLIVADASKHDHLVRRGYVRIGDYAGDGREGSGAPRSYYQTTVGGRSKFCQGVAQTVHETWQGVDSHTGADQAPRRGSWHCRCSDEGAWRERRTQAFFRILKPYIVTLLHRLGGCRDHHHPFQP